MYTSSELLTRWPTLDVGTRHEQLRASLQLSSAAVDPRIDDDAARAARALWQRDASAWSSDTATQAEIADRLGWLTSPALMASSLSRLQTFAESIRNDGFTDVVLLGMGGSSLAPEVMRSVFGRQPGWPALHMIDSTDPASVRAITCDPSRTLYILASKSGTTIEPNSLAAHFRGALERAGVGRWGNHFIAITDDGTELAARAEREQFRDAFINPSDIGGRYSAVSFFGLVPAALIGLDVAAIAGWALAMLAWAEPRGERAADNPAAALALAIGSGMKAGRDKLTLVLSPELEAFGLWVEQLVAESTGKQGLGVVPIAGEPLGDPAVYGHDRVFVALRTGGDERATSQLERLQSAGHPVVDIRLAERAALGAEFLRWEIATAIAGALLRINPFDQPNVQQAKDATGKLLNAYKSSSRLPSTKLDRTTSSGIELTLSAPARDELGRLGPEAFITLVKPGLYFALLAYLGPDARLLEVMTGLRTRVRDTTAAATMFGYGPRYLHSTGQLHKGGANNGVFLIVTATPDADVEIPGEPYSFGTLELAQALGDFASLEAAGRRALHVHLPAPDAKYLREMSALLLR